MTAFAHRRQHKAAKPVDVWPRSRPTSETVIVIDHEPFGQGYDVRVFPVEAGARLDREFPDLNEAQGYAAGLSAGSGWRVVNRASHHG